jgi:hypothetical protein
LAKKPPEATIEGVSKVRVFAASVRAISNMGKSISHSDESLGTISYNTGMSMRSMAGQDMTITVFEEAPDVCRVVAAGTRAQRGNLGGGGQFFDWGERRKVAEDFFVALDKALSETPEPVDSPPSGSPAVAHIDELERLAALHRSGALDDDEFRAAKVRLLGQP